MRTFIIAEQSVYRMYQVRIDIYVEVGAFFQKAPASLHHIERDSMNIFTLIEKCKKFFSKIYTKNGIFALITVMLIFSNIFMYVFLFEFMKFVGQA